MLILLSLDIMIRLFPNVSFGVYSFLTNRSMIWFIIVFIGFYQFYKWYWPSAKFDVNFTGDIHLNDVSKLNDTRVFSLFYPRTINDIENLISKAKSQGKTISLRGQAHTMGGQTLPSRKNNTKNYVCDLKYMNHVEYNELTKEALVEAGATWTHVIKKLNSYGRSPVIMQSYCTFSVAGTISVNAHGITSDDAMYESVISIEYIDMNGKKGECNREKESELFSLMIGGYGLFGIITRLRLKTVSNVKTSLEYIRLQVSFFCCCCMRI
jgi:FAD/FMN-containing dehydrogenase